MLSRLAPLALVMASACHSTPAAPPSRILGTWIAYSPGAIDEEPPLEQLVAEQIAAAVASDYRGSETYAADGTWVGRNGRGSERRAKWKMIEDNGERIRVSIDIPWNHAPEMKREWMVEAPDVLREMSGMNKGLQFVRVRRAE